MPARRNFLAASGAAALLVACGGDGDPAPLPGRSPAEAAAAAVGPRGLAGVVCGHVTATARDLAAAGLRRVGGSAALATGDLLIIGSNTKAMTSAVAGRLVERGLARWDLTVAEALPAAAAAGLAVYRGITLEQLLDHRGGLPAFTDSADFALFIAWLDSQSVEPPADETGRRAFFSAWVITQNPPAGITPGRDFLYSNAGYVLAAAMLEAVTGETWQSLFAEHITRALGVNGSWTRPELVGADQPVGHLGARGALAVVPPFSDEDQRWLDVIAPDGLFATTAADYAAWLRWHLLALKGEATPLATGYVQRLRALTGYDYALGWQRSVVADRPIVFHAGRWAGFSALAMLDLAGRGASFAHTNTEPASEADDWVFATLNQMLLDLDARYR